VLLINGRSEVWKDDRGEYVALGDIFDLVTRQSFPRSPGWAWAGVGRTYVLAPGESASLRVGFHHEQVDQLAPGLYGLRAHVPKLALDAPPGQLSVTP